MHFSLFRQVIRKIFCKEEILGRGGGSCWELDWPRYPNWAPMLCVITASPPVFTNLIPYVFGLSYLLSVACLQTKFLTFLLYIRYPSHNWAPMLCVITAISPVFTNLILFGLSYFLSVVCLRLVSYKFLHCLVTSLLPYAPMFCSIPCLQQIHFWRLFCILAFPICSIWCIVKNGAIGFY